MGRKWQKLTQKSELRLELGLVLVGLYSEIGKQMVRTYSACQLSVIPDDSMVGIEQSFRVNAQRMSG